MSFGSKTLCAYMHRAFPREPGSEDLCESPPVKPAQHDVRTSLGLDGRAL